MMVRDLETKFEYPIAGTLRIGEKNERNVPQKLDYFTVHEDTHTIKSVVNQFNSKYDKPKELVIKFLSDNPFEVSYVRYGKSGLLCKGDGENAKCKEKEVWNECKCSKECTYRGKECKLTGRLNFIIRDLNIGGLWRLQTQSYNTIQNFLATLNFLKYTGVDIKQKEFRIATEENKAIVNGKVNKFTTINLKMIENVNKSNTEDNKIHSNIIESKETKILEKENKEDLSFSNEQVVSKELDLSIDDYEKCLTLIEIKDITKGNKTGKIATFCNMKDEIITFLIHPDIINEFCEFDIQSTIVATDVYIENNYKILKAYKEINVIKKAV